MGRFMKERPQTVGINQSLYGYDSGHRELASSLSLSIDDKHAMLVFTDRAAPVHDMPARGYLVGFPLKDAGAYALVRTWPAPEMDRPGSVWSHALLIDFALMAQVPDLSIFRAYFRRPEGPSADLSTYRTVEPVFFQQKLMGGIGPNEEAAATLIHALYADTIGPAQMDVSHLSAPEDLVFALWSQQWPRLRRGFKFCTFCDLNKTDRFSSFDLQLFNDKRVGQRSAYVLDTLRSRVGGEDASWISVALEDLTGESYGLREFLKTKASDVSDGRRHFRRLCEIYRDLTKQSSGAALARAVTHTLEAFSNQEGRLLREEVVRAAVNRGGDLPIATLKTVLVSIDRSGLALSHETVVSLGNLIWRRMPALFLSEDTPSVFFNSLEEILPGLEEEAIVKGLEVASALSARVLPLATSVFASERAWASSIAENMLREVSALSEVFEKTGIENKVIAAFCQAAPEALAEEAASSFDKRGLIAALAGAPELLETRAGRKLSIELMSSSVATEFINALARPPVASVDISLLTVWADLVQPLGFDRDRNSTRNDPWLALAENSSQSREESDGTLRLACWILRRGLRLERDDAAASLSFALDPIFAAVLSGRLPTQDALLFRADLVSVDWWDWVSDADRIIQTIARKARHSGFTIEQFVGLTKSDALLRSLVSSLSYKYKGRKYLDRLKDEYGMASEEAVERFERVMS